MSRDFDDISKQIIQQNKDLKSRDNSISKEISDLKKSVKNIENKIRSMDDTLIKLFDILNTITVFIEDAESINDSEDEEDWTPYDERSFAYDDEDDDDDENVDGWGIREDES